MDFDYEGADEFGGRILWARIVVALVAALFIFLLGRCAGGGGDISQAEFDTVSSELAVAEAASQSKDALISQLQTQLLEAQNAAGGQTTLPDDGTGTTTTTPTDGATTTDLTTQGDGGNRIYEVQSGDTLAGIAQQVYGDPRDFGLIASANNLVGDNVLQVGQELIIPANPDQAGQ